MHIQHYQNLMQSDRKNILVTGGLGYIGSHTVVNLIELGYTPIIIDNQSNSNVDVIDKIEKITGVRPEYIFSDVRDSVVLSKIFRAHKIYAVIHFAAFKSVSESTREPLKYYDNNLNSTIQLLKVMKEHGVKNIIFSSSCTVYGQPESYPVDELTPIQPAESPYGETKRMCEQMLEKSKNDFNVVILRYFNPIGVHESGILHESPKGVPDGLMPYITGVINGEYPFLRIFGDDYNTKDGTAVRDYIDVNDLAAVHVKSLDVIDGIGFDVFNVGSGSGYTVMEVVESFKNNGTDVAFKMFPRRDGDIEKIYGDISKAGRILKWTPERILDDSVKSILNIKS